jgi:xylan 1,4-beta-xylosidase
MTPNPLIAGFNPDPSIVRVEGVHYLSPPRSLQARAGGITTTVTARAQLAGLDRTWQGTLSAGEVELRIEMTPPPSDFSAGAAGGDRIRLVATGGDREVVLADLDGRCRTFEVA